VAEQTQAETQDLREKVDSLKKDLADLAKVVKEQAQQRLSQAKEKVVDKTGEWAKEHPVASLGLVAGVAASVGFVLGLLAGRGRA